MLVLTRRPGQSVVLGRDIVVTVLASRGAGVRLGIEAPPGVPVRRAELPLPGEATDSAPIGHDFDGFGVPPSSSPRIQR